MARLVRRRLLALGLASAAALMLFSAQPAIAGAGVQTRSVEATVESTIRRQLSAFKKGDAQSAFAIAAPFIQQKFRSPEIFMEMVRRGYPVIYQPASVEFLDLTQLPDGSQRQLVQMSDADGKIWMMEYLLSLDEQGNWRINGVQQQKTSSNLI